LSSVPLNISAFFFSEGGSADYIVTGAWSAKAVKEVNYKKKETFEEVLLWPLSVALILIMYLTNQPQGPYWDNVLQISCWRSPRKVQRFIAQLKLVRKQIWKGFWILVPELTLGPDALN